MQHLFRLQKNSVLFKYILLITLHQLKDSGMNFQLKTEQLQTQYSWHFLLQMHAMTPLLYTRITQAILPSSMPAQDSFT